MSSPIEPIVEPRSARTSASTSLETSTSLWLKWLQGKFQMSDEVIKEISICMKNQETKFNSTISNYQKSIENSRRKMKTMSEFRSNAFESKNELESLFIE